MKTETMLVGASVMAVRGLRETARVAWRWVALLPRSILARGLLNSISDAMVEHERHGGQVTKIVIGPKEYGLLRSPATNYALDPCTDIKNLNDGWMAMIWGIKLFVRKNNGGRITVFSTKR